MTSVGNDIIALQAIDRQKTADPRFYRKIISDTELHHFEAFDYALDIFVWLLWSVKEAVYKCERTVPEQPFGPLRIVVTELNSIIKPAVASPLKGAEFIYEGVAVSAYQKFYFRSVINKQYIFTQASSQKSFENTFCGIKMIPETSYGYQTNAVRELAVERIAALIGNRDALTVIKFNKIYPSVAVGNTGHYLPVSFSHHEYWVACSFIIPGQLFSATLK